jgi:demethylmenaquinone methyltransferase/2-methoxy-6-polyprenyl-1,4-benzoquinol methylase
VLDVCCGTGDLAIALRRRGHAAVVGGDFAHPMLVRALAKTEQLDSIAFVESDALRLPFADASFDLVTAAFGFRNLANYESGLREMRRVLRPGGEVGILEFSEARGVFGTAYRFYLRRIVPKLGGAVSGSPAAYSYLPASVAQFPAPEDLAVRMSEVGFADVQFELWTGGSVALHTARRR